MIRCLLSFVLGLFALVAAAQTPVADEDAPAVKAALAPFRDLMARLPPVLRERMVAHARIWAALAPEEQERLRANLLGWDELGPQDKLVLRERFEAWEHLDAATRAAAVAAAGRYRQLPVEGQQRLREAFAALPAAQRQRFLFDPGTRAVIDLADQLFPFVPVEEQGATLGMLRGLDPDQLTALRQALSRLPPARRDSYRQHLLELDPAARAAELAKPR